ncbi:MAG: hypothetical protein KAR20_14010, partial [Candidatus Heimdallarchaeota archaeon]|nr:hypothetical protein [Candidatus Heimdallarchaeota archaeon]
MENEMHKNRVNSDFDIAFREIDRSAFINSDQSHLVVGQSIPSTETLRQFFSILKLRGRSKVLHIGAGLGYASAVLSTISKKLIAIEKVHSLAVVARENIYNLGINNVEVIEGDGSQGAPEEAPFDIIVVSTPTVKDKTTLLHQLSAHGQMICIEYGEESMMMLVKYSCDRAMNLHRTEHGILKFSQNQDEILIELGLISDKVLQEARINAEKNKTLVIDEVRKLVSVNDVELYSSLARQHGLILGNVEKLLPLVDPLLFDSCSKAFLDHKRIIPLYVKNDSLVVATNNPDVSMAEIQKVFSQINVEKILVTPTDFLRLWSTIDLSLKAENRGQLDFLKGHAEEQKKDHFKPKQEAHLISLFEALLLDAVADGGS